MRALILVAGAALAVSACGSNESANNTANVDENLGVENIATDNLTVDANSVNITTNGTDNAAANATNDAMNADLTNNSADTNLANGM